MQENAKTRSGCLSMERVTIDSARCQNSLRQLTNQPQGVPKAASKMVSICLFRNLERCNLLIMCVLVASFFPPVHQTANGQDRFIEIRLIAHGAEVGRTANGTFIAFLPHTNLKAFHTLPYTEALGSIAGIKASWCRSADLLARNLDRTTELRNLDFADSDLRYGLLCAEPLPLLHELALQRTQVSHFEFLRRQTDLRVLDLASTTFGDLDCECLFNMCKLKSLNISRSEVSASGLRKLTVLPNLEVLRACEIGFTDDNYRILLAFKRLKRVQLSYQNPHTLAWGECGLSVDSLNELRASGLEVLGSPSSAPRYKIVTLDRNGGRSTRDWTWEQIVAYRERAELVEMDLSGSPIDDVTVKLLGDFPNLQSLSCTDTRITDSALSTIAGLNRLQRLDVSNTRISDSGIDANFKGPSQISELVANDTYAVGVAINENRFPDLQRVSFSRTGTTRWPSVRILPASTDAGLAMLSRHSTLRELEFSWSDDLDEWRVFELLRGMEHLEQVTVWDHEVSENIKEELSKEPYSIKILDDTERGLF